VENIWLLNQQNNVLLHSMAEKYFHFDTLQQLRT